VGVDARTALTAYVFQVSTASGGGPGVVRDFAGATATAAPVAAAASTTAKAAK